MNFSAPFLFWAFLVAASGVLIWGLSGMLLPFVVGFAVAYLLNPVVERLTRWHLSRTAASGLILCVFLGVVGALAVALVPLFIREMAALAASAPDIVARALTVLTHHFPWLPAVTLSDLTSALSEHTGQAARLSAGFASGLLNGGQSALGVLAFVALMPVVAFYMMVEWPRILSHLDELLPRAQAGTVRALTSQIDRRIAGFIRGQIIVCFMLAIYYALGLSLVGLQYGAGVGFLAGLLSIIPFVGSIFGLGASIVIALFQVPVDGWSVLALALGVFALGQFAEGNFITPKIVGQSVGLHPLWIIFALLAGGQLLGLLGMFIAVPTAAALAVLLSHAAERYKGSVYYKGAK